MFCWLSKKVETILVGWNSIDYCSVIFLPANFPMNIQLLHTGISSFSCRDTYDGSLYIYDLRLSSRYEDPLLLNSLPNPLPYNEKTMWTRISPTKSLIFIDKTLHNCAFPKIICRSLQSLLQLFKIILNQFLFIQNKTCTHAHLTMSFVVHKLFFNMFLIQVNNRRRRRRRRRQDLGSVKMFFNDVNFDSWTQFLTFSLRWWGSEISVRKRGWCLEIILEKGVYVVWCGTCVVVGCGVCCVLHQKEQKQKKAEER